MENETKYRGLKKHTQETNRIVIKSLQESLLLLLKEKPYDKITIIELCERAGVSRMAFYGNFKTKYDILKRIVIELNGILFQKIGSPFRETTKKEWFIQLFNLTYEKKDVLKLIFESGFQNDYLTLVNKIVLHDDTISAEKKYQRLIFVGGMVNVIAYWIRNNFKESIEEMAEYCNCNFIVWSN